MLTTCILAILAAAPVQAGTPGRDVSRGGGGSSLAADDQDGVDSITDLVTPFELRWHGWTDDATVGGPDITSTFLGNFGSGGMSTVGGGTTGYSLWEVRAKGSFTGTGFQERFYFSEPIPRPTSPAPLLVFMHRFGKTHLDIAVSTNYLKKCAQRGWYVVAPMAASNKHFMSNPAQLNQEFVLDWILNSPYYQIDTSRIYGIGFSMGGGMVTNYAARHLDPAHAMFAAIVNHTGDVSLNHTYFNDPPAQFIFDFWYGNGAPGSADPDKMAMASVIDFDQDTQTFLTNRDLARNIAAVPMMMVRASNDLIDYLEVQADQYDWHIQNVLGIPIGPTYQYCIYPFNGHDWSMLPEDVALDFLQQFTLQIPTSGRILAIQNKRYYWFTVTQTTGNGFSEFDWSVDATANTLSLTNTSNLDAITVDTSPSGLDTLSTLTVNTGTTDGTGDEIYLRGYPAPPSQVLHDGVPTGSWFLVQGILRLNETDSAPHTWTVVP